MLPPFQEFLDSNADIVHRFLISSVPPHEVDDCFQETFIAALRAYPKVHDASNLTAWVLTIAARKAIDGHRKRTRFGHPAEAVPDGPGLPAAEADPQLWAAVRDLPEMQRGAVVLRYVNDLRYRDIAAVLGCSEAAARQNAKAGLDKLKEVWR